MIFEEFSRRDFQELVEHLPVGVLIYRRDGTLVYSNRVCSRIYGVSEEARTRLLGTYNFFQDRLVSREIKERVRKEVLEEGKSISYRTKYSFALSGFLGEGGFVHLNVIRFPLCRGEDGAYRYFGAVVTDVTEEVERMEELRKARDMLHYVVHTLPVPALLCDYKGWTLIVNRKFAETVHPGSRFNVFELFSEAGVAGRLKEVVLGETVSLMVKFPSRLTGTLLYLRVTGVPVFGKEGEVEKLLYTFEDLTDLHKLAEMLQARVKELEETQEEVRGSEESYRYLFLKAANPTVLFLRSGTILEKNRAAERDLSGVESVWSLLPREEWEERIKDLEEGEDLEERSVKAVLPTGEERVFDVFVLRVKEFAGEPLYLLALHDRTAERRTLEEEQRLRRELEKLLQIKDVYFRAISHEFNTPISVLGGYISYLLKYRKKNLDGETLRILKTMEHYVNTLKELVEKSFGISRLTTGEKQELECVHLRKVVYEAINRVRRMLGREFDRLSVEVNLGSEEVIGSPQLLREMLVPILVNSYRFTRKGKRIRIGAEEEKEWCVLWVEDESVGVKREHLNRIFEPFFTTQPTDLTLYGSLGEGTGLGLSLVREIAEALGGKVWADSPGYDPESTNGLKLFVKLRRCRGVGEGDEEGSSD